MESSIKQIIVNILNKYFNYYIDIWIDFIFVGIKWHSENNIQDSIIFIIY